MSLTRTGLFTGHVVHKRLSPKRHGFKYRVFALCLDVDRIDETVRQLRFFSRNSGNIVSFHDRDHGRGDGTRVGDHARQTLGASGLDHAGVQILLLCYPRILGYVFNPLSVYFCYGEGGALGAVIYEVSNTFGERTSYVIDAAGGELKNGVLSQSCDKAMYVSPFTEQEGRYGFHVRPPEDDVVVGIDFRDHTGPVLKTHFRGSHRTLTDRALLAALARHPAMTVKILGAIHVEAVRLWLKGVPPVKRHRSPAYSAISVITQRSRNSHVER